MKVVIDIETDRLKNPRHIWVVVCREVETNNLWIFRNITEDLSERKRFLNYFERVGSEPDHLWIGHNILGFDLPVLVQLIPELLGKDDVTNYLDTLVVSRLVNYSRPQGHSIEDYGLEFNLEKISFKDFSRWSQELEDYCIRDVDINLKVYKKYLKVTTDPQWYSSIELEQLFQYYIVNALENNGFYFDVNKAKELLSFVTSELEELDKNILREFPPKEILIKEFTPKATKFGTISKTSVPRSLWDNIHEYEVGKTYRHTKLEPFNPSSHKQIISVLNEAGWSPVEKTQTHIDTERELNRLKFTHSETKEVDLVNLTHKLDILRLSGWKVSENNLSTLPPSAPTPARTLAKRILLESRRRSLVEWLGLVQLDGRIHGKFYGIGAWTHRMSHQNPNTANIPREFKEDNTPKLLGREMRELWCAPENRLLVGVDAEGIQLRVFAHLIDDAEFTDALVKGKKSDKTDPHSLNQRVLGSVCKGRQAAKRFIYALLLGAGLGKLSQVLECSETQTREALDRLLDRYRGFAALREKVIPLDAQTGYFTGLDGRKVPILGETISARKHLAMSGYLQNGEAVIIKRAAVIAHEQLSMEVGKENWMFVDIVHDELQSETINDMKIALKVAEIKADAIKRAGEFYKLKCPMAGSYWNDDHNHYTIGTNWYQTH